MGVSIAAVASYFGASAATATAIGAGTMVAAGTAAIVGTGVAITDANRRSSHAAADALRAQQNQPALTPTPVMPLADDKATQAKRQQTIIAAQNNALLTGNNRAGTTLTSDKLGG